MNQPSSFRGLSSRAFTLVEMLVSVALLAFLMIILATITESAGRAWREGQSRTDAFQSARASLELLARELTPAVVDTRMQMVVAPGTVLTAAGAKNVAPNSPAILWMAPLGDAGSLRCVGYYLTRDDTRKFYRLKRLFIAPTDGSGNATSYFPRTLNLSDPRDTTLRTSPTDASWFTRTWNANAFDEENPANTRSVVSSAADGVIALWIQCLDALGNPIPLVSNSGIHPNSALFYNSAAFFQAATTTPFENGLSFNYLAQTPQTLKANRVPAAVSITMVLLDSATLARGVKLPPQQDAFDGNGALDLKKTLNNYGASLRASHIYSAHTFSTRATLINGS